MKLTLPKLTEDLDLEPIGYPGLIVRMVLNPGSAAEDAFPWEEIEDLEARAKAREEVLKREPWCSEFYYRLGRIFDAIIVPPGMIDPTTVDDVEEGFDPAEPLELLLPDAKAIYDLWLVEGFDHAIFTWASGQYGRFQAERLAAESKN